MTHPTIIEDRQQEYKAHPGQTFRGPVLKVMDVWEIFDRLSRPAPADDTTGLRRLLDEIGTDPRTPEQRDRDEEAAEGRETYQSLQEG